MHVRHDQHTLLWCFFTCTIRSCKQLSLTDLIATCIIVNYLLSLISLASNVCISWCAYKTNTVFKSIGNCWEQLIRFLVFHVEFSLRHSAVASIGNGTILLLWIGCQIQSMGVSSLITIYIYIYIYIYMSHWSAPLRQLLRQMCWARN